jgi:hypothetical protein
MALRAAANRRAGCGNGRSRVRHGWQVCALLAAASLQSGAAEHVPAGRYDLTIETGMPHLEENLRYAITHEQRCLADEDLANVFPILSHPALAGCRLEDPQFDRDAVSLRLACASGHGTTGHAVWHLRADRLSGILDIRLGGKNMTFFQRVRATRLGACTRIAL